MYGTNNTVTIVQLATYNGLAHDKINGTYTSISNVTLDSYDVTSTSSSNVTATGDVGGSSVTATQNRAFDVLNLGGIQTMSVFNTNIDFYVRTTSGKSIHGSETAFTTTTLANKLVVVDNDNLFFTAQLVASEINESGDSTLGVDAKGTGKSLYTILELSTTNTKQSFIRYSKNECIYNF